MKASIIVSTHNHEDIIPTCIEGLLNQNFEDTYEIIIISDNSTDNTNEIIKSYQEKNGNIRFFSTKEDLYISSTRNFGIEKAEGDIIAFIDGDCKAQEDWLSKILKSFNNNISGVYGITKFPHKSKKWERFRALKYILKSGKYYETEKKVFSKENWEDMYLISGRNMAFKKGVFNKVGDFNNGFYRGGEDIEFQARVIFSDRKLVYNPKVVVYHYHPHSFIEHLKKCKNYAEGDYILKSRLGRKIMENRWFRRYTTVSLLKNPFFLSDFGTWIERISMDLGGKMARKYGLIKKRLEDLRENGVEYVDKNAKTYFSNWDEVTEWWNPKESDIADVYEKEIDIIKENVEGINNQILEIGCGKGRVSSNFVEKNEVTGLDINKKMLKITKERYQDIKTVKGGAENLPFKDNKFDIVIAGMTFVHLPNPKRVLKECYRVLRVKGKLIVDFDNYNSLWRKYRRIIKKLKAPFSDEILGRGKYRSYREKKFKRMLEETGFKIKKFYRFGSHFNFLKKIFSDKYKLYFLAVCEVRDK